MPVERIAFVCDETGALSAHFGQAPQVIVVTVEDGRPVARDTRDKVHSPPHDHDHDHDAHAHRNDDPDCCRNVGRGGRGGRNRKFDAMRDCQVMVVRGIGKRALGHAREYGLRVYAVPQKTVDEALLAYLDGTLAHDPRRVHA
ncbi:MAG: hypothetical protein JXJ20_04300 [Anaerolineae bacterium]|jgi:predicted Fe-Mo cluster-binding NifX family protein|nr:hypothetical protein [Anaerolineae bacterium]